MKLVDIIGGKVVIHPDLYFIPAFKKLYDLDKEEDKFNQLCAITYIVLMHKWDSPYKDSMDETTRESRLKEMIFCNSDYVLSKNEQLAEKEFIDWQNTRTLQMLDGMLQKLDSITQWYTESLGDELDERKIKDILAGMTTVGNVIKSIETLKTMVRAGEATMGKVKGDAKVNPYELAR